VLREVWADMGVTEVCPLSWASSTSIEATFYREGRGEERNIHQARGGDGIGQTSLLHTHLRADSFDLSALDT